MLTSSGQAANFYAIFNICQAGDHFVCSSAIYGGTFNLFGVLTQYVGEMSEWAFWLLLVSSAIAALAAVVFINRSSDRKIEFSMKPAENTDGQE